MLSKPENGWTKVTLGDFQTEASYLVDLPFDWLRSCIHSLRSDLPLSLRPGWWPFNRRIVRLAPWVWRAIKLKRKLF